MRAFVKPNAKASDLLLPHVEIAFTRAQSKATRMSIFKIVYGVDPLSPLDLVRKAMDEKPSV